MTELIQIAPDPEGADRPTSLRHDDKTVRINLGCGPKAKHIPGFINVDCDENCEPDVLADLAYGLPMFENESAAEIHMYHVIEHIWPKNLERVFRECRRILQPGGVLVLEQPDIVKCAINLLQVLTDGEPTRINNLGVQGFFGDGEPGNEASMHKWGYTHQTLTPVLQKAGFKYIELHDKTVNPAKAFAATTRDFRVVAKKEVPGGPVNTPEPGAVPIEALQPEAAQAIEEAAKAVTDPKSAQ